MGFLKQRYRTPHNDHRNLPGTRRSGIPYRLRPIDQIAQFFDGLEMIDPGLVPMSEWRPDATTRPTREDVGYGAVARIP